MRRLDFRLVDIFCVILCQIHFCVDETKTYVLTTNKSSFHHVYFLFIFLSVVFFFGHFFFIVPSNDRHSALRTEVNNTVDRFMTRKKILPPELCTNLSF